VTSAEADAGRRFAEARVKQLTGGDRVKARQMRQDFFEFSPTHKLWLAVNHAPVIRGTDAGIWRRIHTIPFNASIPEDRLDPELPDRLKGELSGILRWAVDGCLEWRRAWRLAPPDAVRRANADYRARMDHVAQFLDAFCEWGATFAVDADPLYRAYADWCRDNGEAALSQRAFGTELTERGAGRARGSGGRWKRTGLRLREPGPRS
jgi:putative DNA primase/helicase